MGGFAFAASRFPFDRGRRTSKQASSTFSVLLALLMIAFLCALATIAGAAPNYPELTGRIVDNANLINAEDKAAIESDLRSLEGTSTDQVAVVTVPTLDGYTIEDYGIGLARKWAIGQKDKDNGVVLIVAPSERKVRIEVGRRLEPTMTDTMAKLIIENAILAKFRRGDFSGGIRDGVRDIKSVLLGDAEEVKRRAMVKRTPEAALEPYIDLILFALIVVVVVYHIRRSIRAQQEWERNLTPDQRRQLERDRRLARNRDVVIFPGGSGNWGGGWSGGSSSGGGWSGGGGSFGGGGASGDW
jgi:uncharacterized protein